MNPDESLRDIDQWLEAALSQYGKAEPRSGLESRVLANLQAERNRRVSQRRWWWALGAATAAVAIVAMLWVAEGAGHWHRQNVAAIATHGKEAGTITQSGPAVQSTRPARASEVARRRPANRPARALAQATAKLEQFPTPAPLSEQEELLARYVQQFPRRAALIARAQTDLEIRNQLEMAAPWPWANNADGSGVEQQQ